MPVTTVEKELLLLEDTTLKIYEFGVAQQTISPEGTIKNEITAIVEKKFIRKDELGYLYEVKVSNRSQSNIKDMLGLEQEIAFLQKHVILYTNDCGEIVSILNRGQVANAWRKQAKVIEKEYAYLMSDVKSFLSGIEALINDDVSYVSLLKKSEIYSVLFPPIYNQGLIKKRKIEQEKKFDNFFETTRLPLLMNTAVTGIHVMTKGKQIVRSGKLDRIRFDKESASKLFAKSYGANEYSLKFNASYLETLDLDEEGVVDKANAMFGVSVNDLYELKQISKLKKIK